MRTLIDVEKSHIEALDQIAKQQGRSRAALVRNAIAEFLDRHSTRSRNDAFGLWKDRKIGGLEYQERMRDEW